MTPHATSAATGLVRSTSSLADDGGGAARPGRSGGRPGSKRAVVVVTEGAEPTLLERWSAAGALPGFARLKQQGAWGRLTSGLVPYEPPGLVTAFTGDTPGHHGVFSYWDVHSPDYRPRTLTEEPVSDRFLWWRDDLAGTRFAVVNVFGCHPPRPVDGWLVTYPMATTLGACHPRRLLRDLHARGIRCIHDVSVWFSGQSRERFVSDVLAADAARCSTALLALEEDFDVVVVNLTAIDRLSHVYWQEIEPGSRIPELESAVFRAYAHCDAFLTQLLDRIDDATSLLAFSEIGFGPLRAYCSINDALAERGLLELEAPDRPQPAWDRTRAFEAVQGTHGVNLNLRGRQSRGTVAREDFERARADLMAALGGVLDPHTGLPLFDRVLAGEDCHPGPCAAKGPDVVVLPTDERYLPFGDAHWSVRVRRNLQSGWHRRDSYWSGIGPSFVAGPGRPAQLADVAPTLYAMLGMDPPRDLRGTPLARAAGAVAK